MFSRIVSTPQEPVGARLRKEGPMKGRYSQRVSVKGAVTFSSAAGLNGKGTVLDLTVPGCMIESTLPPRKGDSVLLNLFIPEFGAHFYVSMGIVRWVEGHRFGVEFIGMEQNDRLRYNAYVADCLRQKNGAPKSSRSRMGPTQCRAEKYLVHKAH